MKNLVQTILALGLWALTLALFAIGESDLSFGETILYGGLVFIGMYADGYALTKLIEREAEREGKILE